MQISLKRVYDTPAPEDGYRVLVDRLWPRGLTKEHADLDVWEKDLAPSDELRKWFHHDPELWDAFSEKYRHELESNNYCQQFLDKNIQQEKVTLVYAAKDELHCHPIILKSYLEKLLDAISSKD